MLLWFCPRTSAKLDISNTQCEVLLLMHYHKTNVVKDYDTKGVINCFMEWDIGKWLVLLIVQ